MKQKLLVFGLAAATAVMFAACQKDPMKNLTARESRI